MPPPSRRPRALVIGGSLAGLSAANLLLRQGWDVEVFEQSTEKLEGRGAGIITHPGLFDVIRVIGIPVDDTIGVAIEGRIVIDRSGALIGKFPLPQVVSTWGRLYLPLKAAFPSEHYHLGYSFDRVSQAADGIVAHFANGESARGDLLIGADGLRSAVRGCLLPEAQPVYAGYVAWRGLVDENALSAATHRDLILESPRIAFDRVALIGDAAFVARPHCGMGTTKAACDAMCLAQALRDANDDVPVALARYQAGRARYGAGVVAHGRELEAHLQGIDTPEATRHHTPEAVMRKIAITRDYP
ncbi:MAG: FAD-dependent monooxygenase [Betaproteobacteria bacterium]|nr:FAD-dependent monooxygenase [Betaproteobacteria bacterium]